MSEIEGRVNDDTPRTYGSGWTLEELKRTDPDPLRTDLIAHIEELEAERDEAEARYTEVVHLGAEMRAKLQAAERVVEAARRMADAVKKGSLTIDESGYEDEFYLAFFSTGSFAAFGAARPMLLEALAAYDKEQADGR